MISATLLILRREDLGDVLKNKDIDLIGYPDFSKGIFEKILKHDLVLFVDKDDKVKQIKNRFSFKLK